MDASYVIDAATLRDQSRRPPALLDARTAAAYEEGHIPGAVSLDLFGYFVDTSAEGIDRLNQELGEILGGAGIGGNEQVICYEDELGMRAARLLWFIEYAGVPDVRILKGGFPAWEAAGGERCRVRCSLPRQAFAMRPRPEILATAEYVNEHTGRPVRLERRGGGNRSEESVALDVRSLAEHRGQTTSSHGPCCPRAGRIPGSIWLEWTALLSADRSEVRPAAEIRRLLDECGITPEQEVVTYCHRGARAAAAYLALREAGFRRVRNYVGSWHEWAEIPHMPIDAG